MLPAEPTGCVLNHLNPNVYAVAGDWHGNTSYAELVIEELAGTTPVLLHTGDFGYQFTADFIHRVDAAAASAELIIAFVDGNHDNHDLLASLPGHRLSDRIWHLQRGARWTWGGVRYLALGGAASIDRTWRHPGGEWWPAEDITDDDVSACLSGGPADVMLCHDLPAGIPFTGLSPALIPQADLDRSASNRDRIAHVAAETGARLLWHGHHHKRRDVEGRGGLLIAGLAADGGPVRDNVLLRHVIDDQSLRRNAGEETGS